VLCPDAGTRDCRNAFVWDTRQVPEGSYWLVAINHDPPFLTSSVSAGPVRIHHGAGAPPPSVVVLRPDGRGTFDRSYPVVLWATGTGALRFTLSYAPSDQVVSSPPPTQPLLTAAALVAQLDGTYRYDWDLTPLPGPRAYFLEVEVTDDQGRRARSQSRYQLAVYHPPDAGTSVDASVTDLGAPPASGSGGCEVEGAPSEPRWAAPLVGLALALAWLWRSGRTVDLPAPSSKEHP
jgi:MYXO-CTERM domain-containing protein